MKITHRELVGAQRKCAQVQGLSPEGGALAGRVLDQPDLLGLGQDLVEQGQVVQFQAEVEGAVEKEGERGAAHPQAPHQQLDGLVVLQRKRGIEQQQESEQ